MFGLRVVGSLAWWGSLRVISGMYLGRPSVLLRERGRGGRALGFHEVTFTASGKFEKSSVALLVRLWG